MNADENEQNLRDLAAMFVMAALLIRNKNDNHPHEQAFVIADQFMKARKEQPNDNRD
jgi:hypothetical protein